MKIAGIRIKNDIVLGDIEFDFKSEELNNFEKI